MPKDGILVSFSIYRELPANHSSIEVCLILNYRYVYFYECLFESFYLKAFFKDLLLPKFRNLKNLQPAVINGT